jgi:hypothetical protein
MIPVKKFGAFVAIGSLFATVEEFLTLVVLKRDIGSYFLTLIVVFPVFLAGVFFSSKRLDRMFRSDPARELAHILVIPYFTLGYVTHHVANVIPDKHYVGGLGERPV